MDPVDQEGGCNFKEVYKNSADGQEMISTTYEPMDEESYTLLVDTMDGGAALRVRGYNAGPGVGAYMVV